MKVTKIQITKGQSQFTQGQQDAVSLFEKFAEALAFRLPKKTQPFFCRYYSEPCSPSHGGEPSHSGSRPHRFATTTGQYFTISPTSGAMGQEDCKVENRLFLFRAEAQRTQREFTCQ